jgi:opacity protein-like surface antigen
VVKQWKAILVGAACLAAGAGAAVAADAYSPVPAPPPTEEAYAASGFYLRGDAGWSWLDWGAAEDNADAPIAGGGIGYQWGQMFRTDLRFDYGFGYDLGNGEEANIGTATANAYIDMPLDFVVKPYVGAGVGYGFVDAENGLEEDGLAAALTGGASFDVNQAIAVDVGYRFRTIFGEDDDIQDHAVTGGLRFKF